ncbi:MAG: NHL repeat-containing protein [Candidatus Krumholzibacteriia bacterium]
MKGTCRAAAFTPACAGILAALAALAALAVGCGQKITVPHPEGLFSVSAYYPDGIFAADQPLQVAVANNNLFVLSGDGSLTKRTLTYDEIVRVAGLEQPTAFCRGDDSELMFVWEQGARRVLVLGSTDLAPLDSSLALPEVQSVNQIVTCPTGVEAVAGARTFVYLSDPTAGVIHRYVYTEGGGFVSWGLLARSDGSGARSVHEPAGMAVDAQGRLLVCDADTSRNWVIRFDPTPDPTDLTPLWNGLPPLRGLAVPFDVPTCEPASLADVTLGYAAECGQTDWVGRRSSAEGEFDAPRGVAVDGGGRIYVSDSGNNRVQIFTAVGVYDMRFGTAERTPSPGSLALVDWRISSTRINYGAYLFLVDAAGGQVRKFISAEQYIYVNQEPPPPPN